MANEELSKNEDSEKLRNEMIQIPTHHVPNNFKDNLLVPIGCFATITALAIGLWSFRKGRSKLSQHMMQIRIIAQGFTITALVASFFTATGKSF
nr:HIG1 domain family member 2A, mitochondrial-like [Maniola hyperantus]